MSGLGFAARMTPGYAHATWDAMVKAVTTLDQPLGAESVHKDEMEVQPAKIPQRS